MEMIDCNCNNIWHNKDYLNELPNAFLKNIYINDKIKCKQVKQEIREIIFNRMFKILDENI